MKKFALLTILLATLFVVGCSRETEEYDYEADMKELAVRVYEDHVKENLPTDLDIHTVSISSIENLNNIYGDVYELGALEDCTEESRVDLHIDKTTKEVAEFEFFMNCR